MPAAVIFKENEVIGTNQILYKDLKKSGSHGNYWACKCLLCGKIRSLRSDAIKAKTKCKSCAAKDREKKYYIKDNLIGKKFGYWIVIDKDKQANYWKCKCTNCGTIRSVFRGNLTSGKSRSCGCIHSWGEQKISSLLNKYSVCYEKEW